MTQIESCRRFYLPEETLPSAMQSVTGTVLLEIEKTPLSKLTPIVRVAAAIEGIVRVSYLFSPLTWIILIGCYVKKEEEGSHKIYSQVFDALAFGGFRSILAAMNCKGFNALGA